MEASVRLRDHAALHFLVEHEPGIILGHLAFADSDRLLATASRFTAPFLARWMSPPRPSGWPNGPPGSCSPTPSHRPAAPTCAIRAEARRLVVTFMLPGIDALHSAIAPPIDITPYPRAAGLRTGEEPVTAS